jgi:hypothetical protein
VVTLDVIGKSVSVDLNTVDFETFGPQHLPGAESRRVPG